MLTVILLDNGEPNVVAMTFEEVEKELVTIPKSKLIVADSFEKGIKKAGQPDYICLLEPDCLLSPRYFIFMLTHLKKHIARNISVSSAITAIGRWENRFYGYECHQVEYGDKDYTALKPHKTLRSFGPYPIQVAYIPGAVIRYKSLMAAMYEVEVDHTDLVKMSLELSLYFWKHKGRVYLNPKAAYCTTEEYIGLTNRLDYKIDTLEKLFERESI